MLAIKECLIREGVLNLNSPNLSTSSSFHHAPQQFDNTFDNTPSYTLYSNRYSFGSKLDLLGSTQKSISDNSVSDLNSANSATAKTCCQQQQSIQSQSQQQQQKQPIQTKKLPKRYQGHHPHFHHHTAPAYYTDLHLKIHTPEAKDSVNENYQSVYRTPSKLVKDEHQFPKTTTATVAPPPISQKSAKEQDKEAKEALRTAFFRGDYIGPNDQRLGANEPYMISKSKSLNPIKGNSPSNYILIDDDDDENHLPLTATSDGSVVFACANFKPCIATAETVALAQGESQPQISTARSTGRNPQRFANRKRAVRVRSESRPISALYNIICKEKGLDVATTTNDEDSSPQLSYDEKTLTAPKSRRSHSRSASRQTKSLVSSNISNMSGGLGNSSGGDHSQHKATALQQKKRNDKYSPNTIFINDLSDDDDDDNNGETTNRLEDGCSRKNFRLRNSHKKASLFDELKQTKSSSLPPGLVNLSKFSQNHYQPESRLDIHNHASIMSKNSNNSGSNTIVSPTSSKLNSLLSLSNANLNVDPIHLHLSSETLQQESIEQATGAGTTYSSITKSQPQQYQHQPHQASSTASSKADRYSRKHRRLRDEKQRRHTDGAIKLYPSDFNEVQNNDDDHDVYNDYDDDIEEHHLQYHDLNGAGHDFHNLAANTANAKRYITRSQRVNPNESRTTTLSSQNLAILEQQQQDLPIPLASSTTTNIKTIDTNGHHPSVEEMTNSSGKNSNTTNAAAASAATNVKELKIRIPLTSDLTTATTSTTTIVPPCSSITDKKKDEEKQNQLRFTSPTSPKPLHHSQRTSPLNSLDIQKTPSGSDTEYKMSSTNSSPTNRVGISNKKLVPSVSVSMKQNLSEMHCTASRSNSIRSNANSPSSPKSPKPRSQTTECTVTITASPKPKHKQLQNTASLTSNRSPNHIDNDDDGELDVDDDFIEIHDLPSNTFDDSSAAMIIRPRCSTMYNDSSDKSKASSLSNGGHSNENIFELSPVHKSRTSNRSPNRRNEDRDKSSKRKSNLNRSLNEEATPDGDESALRRRRRREMGMSRPLVPNDDADLKALISPNKTRIQSPPKSAIRNDLAYHMEMARRGLDLATTASDRRRAQTASPKNSKENPSLKTGINPSRISKRCDTVAIGDLRKERSTEVNRKMNERTRTGLEEIMKILENANECSTNAAHAISDITNRLKASQEIEKESESLILPNARGEERRPSPVKHATFQHEECIYYEPDPLEHLEIPTGSGIGGGGLLRSQRMLKAKSIERETASYQPAKLSPILRRKSTEDHSNVLSLPGGATVANTRNHIVSILKKKDHLSAGESSSASSNASPVTFSASVVDTPSKHKRAGILKKRSSLDESRYYSRSHSPDERSILIKSVRRNSLEEVANGGSSSSSSAQGHQHHHHHHGILKQSSYDSSKSDGCPSATREPLQPQSILKKKDSTSTPSDGGDHAPKHVSISQAVILAAAELSAAIETGEKSLQDDFTPNNEEYDIKPILKLDSSTAEDSVIKRPKPILKKKSSGDSDEHEIKPILKTSRKSSREEFDMAAYSDGESQQEPLVKPILKTDSPSKRRSLGESDSSNQPLEQRQSWSPSLLKRRTRSLERHDQTPVIDLAAALNAIATSQELSNELVSTLTNSTAGGGATNVSVSERIKSVEKFLANQTGPKSSPSDNSTTVANTSWESPLQNHTNSSIAVGSVAGGVRILKPSVIRRDLLKDRYKTQPVTSDEKNFFKNNISLVESLPSGSAFKPAQSLEGLGFAHISSHGNQSPNAPPSAFTLTRSFTQPLSSSIHTPPQSSSSFKAGAPVPLPRKSPARSHLYLDDTVNSTLSFTDDSGLSCTNNSERIFEMSSLGPDIDMMEEQDPKTPLNKESSGSSACSSGVVRTSSVRARANMFQQMQEKTQSSAGLNREERTSPKRVPRRLSSSPANSYNNDEPKTPNNPPINPDDEIEPSSLPLSERLRFFSSLSEANNRSSGSYTRSPPFNSIERCSSTNSYHHYYMATTPRSSTSLSSASVTPTPTEYLPPISLESSTIFRKDSGSSAASTNGLTENPTQDLTDTRDIIKLDFVKASPFLQITKATPPNPAHLSVEETTPTSILTPTMKRIKLKTIGKLMLPSTFLNDRNNNNSKESMENSTYGNNNDDTDATTIENIMENSGPPKKIGKIKSPFIENCNLRQQKQLQLKNNSMKFDYNTKSQNNSSSALTSLENSSEHHSMETATNTGGGMATIRKLLSMSSIQQTNGHHSDETNTESGKENIENSTPTNKEQILEIRRKFTRKTNTIQALNNSAGNTQTPLSRQQVMSRSTSFNGPHSTLSPRIDDKYAKYAKFFGVASSSPLSASFTKSTSASKSKPPPPLPKQPPPSSTQSLQENFIKDIYDMAAPLPSAKSPMHMQPPVMAINRNVRIWRSVTRDVKRMVSVIQEIQHFDDITLTPDDLKEADKEFSKIMVT